MASDLNVSLIIRGIDRATAPIRKVTRNFEALRTASTRAAKAFRVAADVRQAAEGVGRFARAARGAVMAPIKEFEDFQAAMSAVKAKSGELSGEAFVEMTTMAKKLGATTRWTATEAAQGMEYLAIAGWEAHETMSAIPTVLNLATASGSELGRTADVLSDIMGAFGKDASEAANVSDILATTFTSSNTTLETLFETMKLAGSVATDYGVSMKDIATMTGLMGSAGIKGSLGGTALKATFKNLTKPTGKAAAIIKNLGIRITKTADGSLDLVDVLEQVRTKTSKLDKVSRASMIGEIFGVRGMSGVSNVIRGIETGKFEILANKIDKASGSTDRIATIMDDNAKGATIRMISAISGLYTAVGDKLEPTLTNLKEKITETVQSLTEWTIRHPTLTKAIAVTAAGVAALSTGLTSLLFAVVAASSAIGVLNFAMGGAKTGAQLMTAVLKMLYLRMEAVTTASRVLSFEMMPAKKGMLGYARGIVKMAIPATIAWTTSLWGAAAGVIAATWPILAIIAAITAVTATVYFAVKHWDYFIGVWERFKKSSLTTKIALGVLLGPLAALFSPLIAIAYAAKKIIDNWDPITTFFKDLWGFIKESIASWSVLGDMLSGFKLPSPLHGVIDWQMKIGKAVGGAIGGAAGAAGGAIADIGREVAWVAGGGEAEAPAVASSIGAQSTSEANIQIGLAPGLALTGMEKKGGANIGVDSELMGPLIPEGVW